jgi:hypothetical protein
MSVFRAQAPDGLFWKYRSGRVDWTDCSQSRGESPRDSGAFPALPGQWPCDFGGPTITRPIYDKHRPKRGLSIQSLAQSIWNRWRGAAVDRNDLSRDG